MNNNESTEFVWVFSGDGARLSSAVFSDKKMADAWISGHRLSGMLAKYPVNTGIYDWAIKTNKFIPKRDDQGTPEFIGRFSCASLEHYHYENGISTTGG
jgi:hypothetical protein